MLEGLYSAAAGMTAQQQRMDTLANDVANVNTNGYKHSRVAFRDLLYVEDRSGQVRSGAGAAVSTAGRGFGQGNLRTTSRPLDVGIEGNGFLRVRLADGSEALTRDGALRIDPNGRLTTQRGELLQPAITVPEGTNPDQIAIGSDGTVSANARQLGRIELVTVRATDGLRSLGDNLFAATPESGAPTTAGAGSLAQGTIESSNVDVASAMTDLVDAQRGFQLASKAVQMQDQILQIANQVKS